MGQYTTSFCTASLIAATLAFPNAYAASLGDLAQDHVFFSAGGPSTSTPAAQDVTSAKAPAALRDKSLFTPVSNPYEQVREHALGQTGSAAPTGPNPALFTQVSNPGEQTEDHAFDLFGLKKPTKTAPAASANGQVATAAPTTAPAPQIHTPDPSLFTEVSNPSEQTRDHPFSLF